jgi:hypothetical protein
MVLVRRARSKQIALSLRCMKLFSFEPRLRSNDRGAIGAVPLCRLWDGLQTKALKMIPFRAPVANQHVGIVVTSIAHRARKILIYSAVVIYI